MNPTVERFMTRSPLTIGQDQPLEMAHRLMREHDIRHLPVLDGGKLVGILSLRDLHLIETLRDVDPEEVPVSEAMTSDLFTVGPRSTVRKVAAEMAENKYGSAVVVDNQDKVIGVFTTIDALRALFSVLEEQRRAP